VVAKLGAYTAGGSQGAEQKRIRKHLQTCSSCNALHAELAEVCSTLRAHAASIAVPVAATAFLAPAVLGPAVVGKAAWLTGRVKLVLASAASVAAVGLLGVLAGTFTGAPGPGVVQPGPDGAPGEHVLALGSTTATATGTPTSETPPSTGGRHVVHTKTVQVGRSAPATTTSAEVPAVPPVETTGSTLPAQPRSLPVDTTSEPVTTTDSGSVLLSTTTTTKEPPNIAVTPIESAKPVLIPTTVTVYPKPGRPAPR
jgi:hypothetical protein